MHVCVSTCSHIYNIYCIFLMYIMRNTSGPKWNITDVAFIFTNSVRLDELNKEWCVLLKLHLPYTQVSVYVLHKHRYWRCFGFSLPRAGNFLTWRQIENQMNDLSFKHETELLLQHPLSLADSTELLSSFCSVPGDWAGEKGKVHMRGTDCEIINTSGNDELRIKKSVKPSDNRKTRDLSSVYQFCISFRAFSFFLFLCHFFSSFLCQLSGQLLILLFSVDTTIFFRNLNLAWIFPDLNTTATPGRILQWM